MRLRDKTTLKKIVSEIDVGLTLLGDISLEDFLDNELMKRGIAMTAINIGELVKGLTDEFRRANSHVSWKEAAAFRDIVAHKYETLRMTVVYDTFKNDFPAFKLQIEQILAAEES